MFSSMQLDRIELVRLSIEHSPRPQDIELKDPEKDWVHVEYTCNAHDVKPWFQVKLQIMVDRASKGDQRIDVELEAYFKFPEGTGLEIMQLFVPNTCVAHAINYARNIIYEATSQTKYGPFRLPLLDLVAIEQKKAETANP
ncbi:MAG: hypothetical protein AMXMBFR84_26530 [Candidatus Hydrogenedentota bacterium]